MTRFLPILILSFVISRLSFVTPSFAQDITPSITPAIQINPQAASAWENFLKNLIPAQFKKIPDELDKINCAGLPLEVCESKNKAASKTQNITTQSNFTPLASGQNNNNDLVVKGAKEYTIASGRNTPPIVSNASTNIFLDFLANIAKFISSIFDTGEKEAKNYAGTVAPPVVVEQNFTQGIENITGMAVSNDTNVLGAQTGQAAMEKSLPFVQCSELPPDLCGADNKLNIVQ